MTFIRTLASRPLETLLTLLLVLFALVSVRTLKRARRVLESVRTRGLDSDSELWAVTQVRIEWCILLAQCVTVGLSLHRITTTIWDESRVKTAFHVYGIFRVIVSALLARCVILNRKTCERLSQE